MRDEVEAALPGSACTTDRGTPGLDLRAGLARQLRDAGVGRSWSTRVAPTPIPSCSAIVAGAPTGRLAGLIWLSKRP